MRRALRPASAHRRSDGELLERYVAQRDQLAFAELVERHGSMVLGVCRRITGHAHDADDAYQATFLVLVRRAAAVWPREQVGNWLHGVACRVASEARNRMARRRLREWPTDPLPHPAVEPPAAQDWRPIFDQELQKLPAKYRMAVIVCELEGRPRREAALHLGVPEGTLSSRLAAARRLLADRLARRGVAPAVAALAVVLAREADAATWPAVTSISPNVLALTEGVVRAMTVAKLKVWAAAAAVLIAIAGSGMLLSPGFGAGPEKPRPVVPPRAVAPPPDLVMPPAETQYQIDLSVTEVREKRRWTLAAPKIVTLAGRAAHFSSGGQEAVPVRDGLEFVPVGLQATIKASPDEDRKIQLEAMLEFTNSSETKDEPTWTSTSMRAIRRVASGKTITLELATGKPDKSVLEVTVTVTELPSPPGPPSAAEKDWKAAEFYRRIGNPGAARFYYELILRRYEGSPIAEKARQRMKEQAPPKDEKQFRIGTIQIVGNIKTPDGEILKRISLYPGAVLTYQDVQDAERMLGKMSRFKSPPKVMILGVENDGEFKDIRIIVEEK